MQTSAVGCPHWKATLMFTVRKVCPDSYMPCSARQLTALKGSKKKVCEHINVKHTDVILITQYFYWPIKNKTAMWANRHEFWWWILKPIAKLCYFQCLSNSTVVIKRPKQVSPAHVPIPFPLPVGKACTSSSRCTAVFLAFSVDVACRYQW